MAKRLTEFRFLSTLSLRRATSLSTQSNHNFGISIHALLAESDKVKLNRTARRITFLSTLSLRRATNEIAYQRQINQFLSTLSLRRATSISMPKPGKVKISIHALLAESDCCNCTVHNRQNQFLSTLSLRRATTSHQVPC